MALSEILVSLEDDNVSRVILVGEAGTGKTWMARKIWELSGYIALWLNLNKDLDEISLYENIASQLSVFLDIEEDDIDDDDSEDEGDRKIQELMRLKDKIHQKLTRKIKGKGKKGLLLVLDDEGSVTNEKKLMEDLYLGDFLAPFRPLKILLTRRIEEEDAICSQSRTIDDGSLTLRVILTDDDLVDLLKSLVKDESLAKLHSLEESWGRNDELLRLHIIRMGMRLPAALVVLSKSLNCICQNRSVLVSQYLEAVFKKVNPFSFQSDTAIGGEGATTGGFRENPILRFSYELLETAGTMTMVDCFWHSLSFFEQCGSVYYQELIAHWILEGYFDPVRSVTKVYKEGHTIMMELIRRGFLKIQEGNVVMPEAAVQNLIDLRRRGMSGNCRMGLAKVCGSDMTTGLGKVSHVDDIIEAVKATREGEKITTILVSGNRLRRDPRKFFEKLKDLEILGLFEPKLDPFVPFLLNLVKLRVLVIRDCDLLTDIEELKVLRELHALEVSGASSLKKICDDFFKALSKLQSLHLSGLQIKSSPSSISQLTELYRLVIRNCPLLKDLPDMQELKKLEVVDVSGAHGLRTCFDNTRGEKKNRSKNKNFYHLTNLQLLDLSESRIERLPIFQDSAQPTDKLHSLTRLLLRNCSKLRRLPSLKPLSGLQVLDLSGTSSLVKLLGVCFEDKKDLRILNMSGANVCKLPSTIGELSNLNTLLLKDCTNLESLPNIERLTNLKVFNISGCTKLHTIEGSFSDMPYLHEIDLSDTKVKTPPELPKESKFSCRKRITLADRNVLEGEKWSQIMEAMQSEISENPSSFDAVAKSQENESGGITEIQSNEPRSRDCTEKRGISRKRFDQVPLNRALYRMTLSYFHSASQQEAMEIRETSDPLGFVYQEDRALADAECLSFLDCSSATFTSIFNEIESVKGCWLRMSLDIKILFSDVYEKRLGSLETLLITNLPLLESICWGGSFKKLKNLSIDCCPNIRTLFPEGSQMPSSLEVLHIKFCEMLEEVVEGVELLTFTNLTWKVEYCPNFKGYTEGSAWVMVECSEASPAD